MRVKAEAVQSEVPPRSKAGWWTQTISDGGAHYGTEQEDGDVAALCGARYTPMDPGWGFKAAAQNRPADPEHACPDCKRKLARRG